MTDDQILQMIRDVLRAIQTDISGVKSDIAKLQTDIWWVRWIITGGVGLYVLRSIVEWIR